MAEPLSFAGHVQTEAQLGYQYLPFLVSENTGRIDIRYQCHSDLSTCLAPGENPQDYVADIAVFDPRGAEFMGKGFRGTSGNTHPHIFIAPDDATPGYTPGELTVGEWQLMLGFYKVAPGGCDFQVQIDLTPGSPHPTSGRGERLPLRTHADRAPSADGWYKGELHCHTIHSDGSPTPLEVIEKAEQLGLDFLSITDHNVFTQQIDMNRAETPVMLIPGCEVTTARGHWNIWGEGGWIEFRVTDPDQMEATIAEAKRQGYLTSCNHPRPNGPPWRFPEVKGYQCVEAWNGTWADNNETCLAFWVERLNRGERLPAVGGSDCHHLNSPNDGPLARPMTYVYLEGAPSPAAILDGVRSGHAFVTRAPDGPQLYLSSGAARMGDSVPMPELGKLPITVRVVEGDGLRLELWTAHGLATTQTISGGDMTLECEIDMRGGLYVRAQLRDPKTEYMAALTNPIYID